MLTQLRVLLKSLAARPTPEPPRLRVCDRYANVLLENQFGEQLRFREKFVDSGGAIVVNTMYTTCRGTCPGTSAAIEALREQLSPVFGSRLSFVSFSIDPLVDNRQQLLRYAKFYGADRPRHGLCDWHFLTGGLPQITELRRSLGFYDLNPAVDQDLSQHASTLLFGNSTTDRWASMPAELAERELVTSIRRIAGFTFEQKYGIRS